MTDLLSHAYFQNALVVSVVLGVLFGIFSFIVVLRKMSFLGVGIAHSAFGGVALAILIGIEPFWITIAFCVATALVIGSLEKRTKMSYDSVIGILFSFTMALGAIFLSIKKGFTADIMGYLFGSILGVSNFDKYAALAVLGIFAPFVLLFMKRILFVSFDADVAAVSGIRVRLIEKALLVLFAAIIVISIKIVGIILVSALVALPASFGLLISKNYKSVILIGIAYAVAAMLGGLALSFFLDLPAGASIVALASVSYAAALGLKKLFGKSLTH